MDDEPHVVAYLEMLLQDQGYATVSAANGREGMEKAKEQAPDLICLDITMPEESGVRFYRNLKEDPELAPIPVLVVTAVTGLGGDPEPFRNFLNTRKHIPPPGGILLQAHRAGEVPREGERDPREARPDGPVGLTAFAGGGVDNQEPRPAPDPAGHIPAPDSARAGGRSACAFRARGAANRPSRSGSDSHNSWT